MKSPNPVVSANGSKNGIVWMLEYDITRLSAYDPDDLTNEYYDSDQNRVRDQPAGQIPAVTPTVANGRVYVPTTLQVEVYGLIQ